MEFLVSQDRRTRRTWVVCNTFSLLYGDGVWQRGAPTVEELKKDFEYIADSDTARQFYEAAVNAVRLYPELGRCIFGRMKRAATGAAKMGAAKMGAATEAPAMDDPTHSCMIPIREEIPVPEDE